MFDRTYRKARKINATMLNGKLRHDSEALQPDEQAMDSVPAPAARTWLEQMAYTRAFWADGYACGDD